MIQLKDSPEEIEISKIKFLNKRTHDKDKIKELSRSIEDYSLIIPVSVVKQEDNSYVLCKGQGRVEAHRLLGRAKIKAFVYNHNEVDRKTMIKWWLIENEVREKLSEFDKNYLMSLDYDLLGEKKTAEKYKVKPATVRQYKKTMDKVTPGIRDKVKNGKVSFTIMKEAVSAIKDTEAAEAVIDFIAEDKLRFEESRTAIEMAKKLSQGNKHISARELKESFKKLSDENKLLRPIITDLKTKSDFVTEWLSTLAKDRTFISLLKQYKQRIPQEILNITLEV